MKVTEKKFLNVHQTLSPMVATNGNGSAKQHHVLGSAKAAAEKVLVRKANIKKKRYDI